MSDPAQKATDPNQPQVTVTGFLRKELANTAGLYFAPVTAVVRTISDIWAASGMVTEIGPESLRKYRFRRTYLPVKEDAADNNQQNQ